MDTTALRQVTAIVLVLHVVSLPTVDTASAPDKNSCPPIPDDYEKLHACKLSPDLCPDGATCVNGFESYYCVCAPGFEYDDQENICKDIDECKTIDGYCDVNALCTNTAPWAICECMRGFEGNGHSCRDKDECADSPCAKLEICINLDGDFVCNCIPGYTKIGGKCERDCPPTGCDLFRQEPPDIGPVDHCKQVTCPAQAHCVNHDDSYACACDPGYAMNDAITECQDINECEIGTHDCDVNYRAICINIPGSYLCECKDHTEGDGHYCKMKDTCDVVCGKAMFCRKLSFKFMGYPITLKQCECQSGYIASDSGCILYNKCKNSGSCHEHANCVQAKPLSKCVCKEGYEGNGNHCTDIDECQLSSTCGDNATCANTEGSYKCTCDYGYTGDGKTCTLICPPVDECAEGIDSCDRNSLCTDTDIGYTCTCMTGYTGSGYHCRPET